MLSVTSTEAMMSSGSPMRPRAGTFRWSRTGRYNEAYKTRLDEGFSHHGYASNLVGLASRHCPRYHQGPPPATTGWSCAEVSKIGLLYACQFQYSHSQTNVHNSRLGTKSCNPAVVSLGCWGCGEPGTSGVSVRYV